ncbi:MAG: CBS domain-containing protein [Chloroflexi bacterium]|nr:CBS domain-containing protein [Chloroflexota bacterium]
MATNPVVVSPQESVANAAKLMRQSNVGCLIVTNSNSVQGIVTDRDLTVRCLAEGHNPGGCRVSHHMTSPVTTAASTMDILDAARLMVEQGVKRLPVVDEERLIGLVSLSDIAQAMDRPMHDLLLGMGAARRMAA